ncbi:hypothetical protein COT75_03745 [Candidatus Beckwithbacteria bacterium CG10_big_fil_rev_8_21_14_0_10_34_10]|uniref:SpoVT-AbrB domain-containing protein n=1 Tax=Candidatus Beckwithbacteria bacterium CG10_big_fil_rev_8_21_14_0_10_34_10 TaxID=1974495 RepID=A0A2H0W8F7_9BACT|nr:MAG: hypothetical protein COT75_03745 [Candidatus Beckwithbacteria bacterium CG10_big_fil_rev_8_21_14_0_10_34_10]
MKQKILKVGNSLGVTIPSEFAKLVGIRPGDKVEVLRRRNKNELIYQFSGIQQLTIGEGFLKKKRIKKNKKIKKNK